MNPCEALKPLSFLIGTWRSIKADGFYPTIKPFKYCEEMQFESVGQPMLNYIAKTWNPEKGNVMHLERGFLRINPGTNQVSFLVAHNFGLTSLEEGTACEQQLNVKSVNIARMCFAKDPAVLSIERCYKIIENGQMEMNMSMETSNTPMTPHLKVIYEKVE